MISKGKVKFFNFAIKTRTRHACNKVLSSWDIQVIKYNNLFFSSQLPIFWMTWYDYDDYMRYVTVFYCSWVVEFEYRLVLYLLLCHKGCVITYGACSDLIFLMSYFYSLFIRLIHHEKKKTQQTLGLTWQETTYK